MRKLPISLALSFLLLMSALAIPSFSGWNPAKAEESEIIELEHGDITIDSPVLWEQKVKLSSKKNVLLEVPSDATILKVSSDEESDADYKVLDRSVAKGRLEKGEVAKLKNAKDKQGRIPASEIDDDHFAYIEVRKPAREYSILFTTPALFFMSTLL